MKQRLTAILLLLGFLFVISNILFFKINSEITVFIYVIYILYYLFVMRKKNDSTEDKE